MTARDRFQACDELRLPAHRALYAGLTAEDPYAASLAWLASTLAYLGFIEQARARMHEALSEARRLNHVYTVVWVLGMICWVDKVVGSSLDVRQHAEELVALADKHGFPLWLGRGFLWQGWSSTELGHAEEGLTLLSRGLSLLRATGAVIATPLALVWLGKAHTKLNQLTEASKCATEAASLIETTNERYTSPS